jgi:alpha-D-xyloside xylohydrolase
VTLRVHAPVDGATVVTRIPAPGARDSSAAVFRTTRDGDTVTVEAEGVPGPWQVLLVGAQAEPGDTGSSASAERTALGTLLAVSAGTAHLTALLTGS